MIVDSKLKIDWCNLLGREVVFLACVDGFAVKMDYLQGFWPRSKVTQFVISFYPERQYKATRKKKKAQRAVSECNEKIRHSCCP
jgi:hypothetical protein